MEQIAIALSSRIIKALPNTIESPAFISGTKIIVTCKVISLRS